MTVYIEYVIIDNLVLDAVIIYFTLRLMRLKISYIRLILSACLGTAFAVLLSLLNLNTILMFFLKLFSGLTITFFIAKFKNILHFLKVFLAFFGITLLLGGACFGVLYLIEGDIERAILMGCERFPIACVIAPASFTAFLIEFLIRRLKKYKHKAPFFYEVEFYHKGECVKATGYLDSGNLLYDGSGNPVVVVAPEVVSALFARSLFSNRKTKFDTINIRTIKGEGDMKIFKPDKLVIYSDNSVNILYDVTVGITDSKFEGYSCLLHPAVIS